MTMQTETAKPTRDSADARPMWQVVLVRPEVMTFALLVGAFIIASNLSPFFSDAQFILESSTYYVEYSIIALVLTLVIISGEIDLSPAAMMALSACVFAALYQAGLPIGLAMIASLATGVLMGLFNGILVVVFKLPSIIVTIGTLTLYRGLAQVLAGDRSIGKFPQWFNGIDYRLILDVPVPVIVFVIISVALAAILGTTVIGRQIYQVGTSEIASIHAGIRVRRIKLGLFVAMGVASSIGGLLTASRLASVRYDMATGGELQMVLMVMLGGTYIFGGRGSILGTFLASWLLVIIATGMTVANIAITAQLIVMGALLIISIIATNAIYARTQR
ncbi:ABC transporter permease [Devosia rhodophyticola]|uniref:Autoinducer 2 import system permease protein LsrD n=1 Tax=Devosia rhodophyticola TaxID=3026423 RepID=A0ABY7YZV5_9HYPH|nr:ABC transporter permease [Devosia rhodophyticola]WDR06702.1 ABC transporter permease [Devosia rhodophyticola]